jgi:16S rRNA (adenine1518-N6/adenine1519-N6)-dimethyltransferase
MTEPQGLGEMRDLLGRHGLTPQKALGQHFLSDPNIVRRIVRLSEVDESSNVLEIGAGTGTLTRGLAGTGARVVAFEIDYKLAPLLEESVGDLDNVEVRMEDAASLDPGELVGEWTVVANLPYHVGTPLLLDLLRHAPTVRRFIVMVQREVADRFTAKPGNKQYGLPTVVVDLHANARFGFAVPPQVFFPPPQVGSAVVMIERKQQVSPLAEAAIELAAAGFSQRRKMLRSSLKAALADPVAVCEKAGIEPTLRAEALAAADWLALAEVAA